MILEPITVRFVRPIVQSIIELLSDHPQISMIIPIYSI